MGSEMPAVSVIIVSYNTREMTLRCLRTVIADLAGIASDIWVVDNASQDGSADAIRSEFPDVHLIVNPDNAGFGAANNLAMLQAQGETFLLLNSDAFVHAGAVKALMDCAKRHPDAAVIGPRLVNSDGSLQVSCYRFPSPSRAWLENLWISSLFPNSRVFGDYRRWAHDSECVVDSVIGACMLVRREAFTETGGFDERYFMYQEETDWQRSLLEVGSNVVFTPTAVVTHLGGASGKAESERVNSHFFDSLDLYQRKHHGILGVISVRAAMVVGCFMRAAAWGVVSVVMPKRRNAASVKSRFHARLCLRQATHRAGSAKGIS